METIIVGALSREHQSMQPRQCSICDRIIFMEENHAIGTMQACRVCAIELFARSKNGTILQLPDSMEEVQKMIRCQRLLEVGMKESAIALAVSRSGRTKRSKKR